MTARWYVVQSRPKHEFEARQQLRQQDFTVFLPLYRRRTVTKRHGIQVIVSPIFPGYLFAQFDPEYDHWRCINGTRGVKGLISMDSERPSPLPRGFIEAMQEQAHNGIMNMNEALEKVKRFNVGDRLKITSGALVGQVGICDASEKNRVKLLFDLLGAKNHLYVNIDQVELAAE